jgi:hypothetical protein
MPWWVRMIRGMHAQGVINLFRRDLHYVPPGQRFSTLEVLSLFDAQRRLRRKVYDTNKILEHGLFAIEDLTFNCIFIRANLRLREIAKAAKFELSSRLVENMDKSEKALESLWDEYARGYCPCTPALYQKNVQRYWSANWKTTSNLARPTPYRAYHSTALCLIRTATGRVLAGSTPTG